MSISESRTRFGQHLRELRKEQQLSLAKLSERSDVSVSMLSHIERGQTMPSLRTLNRICQALNTEMSAIFPTKDHEHEDESAEIVRAKERSALEFKAFGLTKELLSPQRNKSLEFFMVTLEPGGGSGPELLVRQGEKAGLVVQGELNLLIGDKQYRLSEGDSFQFNSAKPHRILNDTEKPIKLLWIIKPDSIVGDI